MTVLLLMAGLLAGLLIGLIGFFAGSIVSMIADDCLKSCNFAIWPIVAAVCAPLIHVAIRDIVLVRRGMAPVRPLSLAWCARRSVPIGMAVSTLHVNRTVSHAISKAIASMPPSS